MVQQESTEFSNFSHSEWCYNYDRFRLWESYLRFQSRFLASQTAPSQGPENQTRTSMWKIHVVLAFTGSCFLPTEITGTREWWHGQEPPQTNLTGQNIPAEKEGTVKTSGADSGSWTLTESDVQAPESKVHTWVTCTQNTKEVQAQHTFSWEVMQTNTPSLIPELIHKFKNE